MDAYVLLFLAFHLRPGSHILPFRLTFDFDRDLDHCFTSGFDFCYLPGLDRSRNSERPQYLPHWVPRCDDAPDVRVHTRVLH